jgi:two-component sensor histidine kinase
MKKKQSLRKVYFLSIFITSLFCVASVGYFWISYNISRFENESENLRSLCMQNKKKMIRNEVEKVLKYIDYQKNLVADRLKERIKIRVYRVHEVIEHLYRKNRGVLPTGAIRRILKETLRPIRYDGGRGYFFIGAMDGTDILFPPSPQLEGKNLLNLKDEKGNWVMRDEMKVIREKGEGYVTHFWKKPGEDSGMIYKKISFVKYFRPFDWYIGTGDYLQDVENDIKEEVLNRIASIRFEKEGYVFVNTFQGRALVMDGKRVQGKKNLWELADPKGLKVIQKEKEAALKPEGDFIYYHWRKLEGEKPLPKISYIAGVPEWNWMVGAGLYIDDVEKAVAGKREELQEQIKNQIIRNILLLLIVTLIVFFIARVLSARIRHNFLVLDTFLKQAATRSEKIDSDKLSFAEFDAVGEAANRMIEEKAEAENQIRKSLKDKEVLLKEVHHRVKNNLQIIYGLLNLQAFKTGDAMAFNALKDSENRIYSMALIHKKLYQSEELGEIDFLDYAEKLADDLYESYGTNRKKIPFVLSGDHIWLDVDRSVACGLILNELISNALKYAFSSGKGEIRVSLYRKGENLELTVGDNGRGLPRDFNIHTSNSLGLELVLALTGQLGGELFIERENGAVFKILFPARSGKQ